MSLLLRRGIFSKKDSGFLTYNHTWVDNAQIQSNKAETDGSGDGIHFPNDTIFDLAAQDFTFETYVNFDAFPQPFPTLFAKWGSAGDRCFQFLLIQSSNLLRFGYTTDGTTELSFDSSWTPSTATDYHVAYCRDGSNLRLFIDGTQIGSTHNISTDSIHTDTNRLTISALDAPTSTFLASAYLDGTQDVIRIEVGFARYTSNFTPPAAGDIKNTVDTAYINTFTGANGSTPTLNTN